MNVTTTVTTTVTISREELLDFIQSLIAAKTGFEIEQGSIRFKLARHVVDEDTGYLVENVTAILSHDEVD